MSNDFMNIIYLVRRIMKDYFYSIYPIPLEYALKYHIQIPCPPSITVVNFGCYLPIAMCVRQGGPGEQSVTRLVELVRIDHTCLKTTYLPSVC